MSAEEVTVTIKYESKKNKSQLLEEIQNGYSWHGITSDGNVQYWRMGEEAYLPEILDQKRRDEWLQGANILITGPPGIGKTSLIFAMLDDAKRKKLKGRALIVQPITTLIEQTVNEYCMHRYQTPGKVLDGMFYDDDVVIMTMAKFIVLLTKDPYRWRFGEKFHHIFIDEAHTVCTAGTYCDYTEKAWVALNSYPNVPVVSLTATPDVFADTWFRTVQKKNRVKAYPTGFYYQFPNDFTYLKPNFLYSDADVVNMVQHTAEQEKTFIYVDRKKTGQRLAEEINKALGQPNAAVFVDADLKNGKLKDFVHQTILNRDFDCKVFISTATCELGLNLVSEKIKNVVVYSTRKDGIIQAVGRKRVRDGSPVKEEVNLYIVVPKLEFLQELCGHTKETLRLVNDLRRHPYRAKDYLENGKLPKVLYLEVKGNSFTVKANRLGVLQLQYELQWLNELIEGASSETGIEGVYLSWFELSIPEGVKSSDPALEAMRDSFDSSFQDDIKKDFSKSENEELLKKARKWALEHGAVLEPFKLKPDSRADREVLGISNFNKILDLLKIQLEFKQVKEGCWNFVVKGVK